MSGYAIAADRTFRVHLNLPGDVVIKKVTSALQQEGFTLLPRYDIETALEQTLNTSTRRFLIMGNHSFCLADLILKTELELTLLLPCTVTGNETDGNQSVLIISHPTTKRNSIASSHHINVVNEIKVRLTTVIENLTEIHNY